VRGCGLGRTATIPARLKCQSAEALAQLHDLALSCRQGSQIAWGCVRDHLHVESVWLATWPSEVAHHDALAPSSSAACRLLQQDALPKKQFQRSSPGARNVAASADGSGVAQHCGALRPARAVAFQHLEVIQRLGGPLSLGAKCHGSPAAAFLISQAATANQCRPKSAPPHALYPAANRPGAE
jgi:hypothetical protein